MDEYSGFYIYADAEYEDSLCRPGDGYGCVACRFRYCAGEGWGNGDHGSCLDGEGWGFVAGMNGYSGDGENEASYYELRYK